MTTQDIRGDGYEGSRHRSKRAAPPRYWVKKREVDDRLHVKGWNHCWLMGWRDITNATNERTMIATVFPMVGVTNSLPLFFISDDKSHLAGVLIGNFSSLILDFYAKHKVGGTHLNFFIVEQLALLPPTAYSQANLDFELVASFHECQHGSPGP